MDIAANTVVQTQDWGPVLSGIYTTGNFVGDSEYLQDSEPRYFSTVVTKTPTTIIEWDYSTLHNLKSRNPSITFTLRALLKDNVVAKSKRANNFAPLATYRGVLMGILADGKIDMSERKVLSQYCAVHNISGTDHANALQSLGWTLAEFDSGKRRGKH
ncbi:hypothetical protein CYMTET_25313 [Cymbomonas tetramitiformis]|uniref:Uncharacterized protein n=1 Tax=Cymbomonas tetramitiformis TaxID=36881 RepID=A0AAE0FUA3_9CHLO|nr:hypothetical protein CYMTET_25313 [Cymbomonas tetramitiformis]